MAPDTSRCSHLLFASALLVQTLAVSCTSVVQAGGCNSVLAQQIGEIRQSQSELDKYDKVNSMADYILDHSECRNISDDTVDALATLLSDENDGVRSGAALALGNIGPRAKRAIPALKAALARIQKELAVSQNVVIGRNSSDVVPGVLRTLGVQAP